MPIRTAINLGMFSDKSIAIGFTGTRRPTPDVQRIKLEKSIDQLRKIRIAHHGDCVGADAEFHTLCVTRGILIHIHPQMEEKHRASCDGAKHTHPPLGYLERN